MKAQHLVVFLATALAFAKSNLPLRTFVAAISQPAIGDQRVEQVKTHAEKPDHNLFDFDGYSRRVEINAAVTPRNIFGSGKA